MTDEIDRRIASKRCENCFIKYRKLWYRYQYQFHITKQYLLIYFILFSFHIMNIEHFCEISGPTNFKNTTQLFHTIKYYILLYSNLTFNTNNTITILVRAQISIHLHFFLFLEYYTQSCPSYKCVSNSPYYIKKKKIFGNFFGFLSNFIFFGTIFDVIDSVQYCFVAYWFVSLTIKIVLHKKNKNLINLYGFGNFK